MSNELMLSRGPYLATRTGLEIERASTPEEWEDYGTILKVVDEAKQWAIGDWLVEGVHHFEDEHGKSKKYEGMGLYEKAEAITGIPYATLTNLKSLSEKMGFSRRRESLLWGHHAEVAGLQVWDGGKWTREFDEKRALEFLALAEENEWSVRKLRSEIQEYKTATEQPEYALDWTLGNVYHADVTEADFLKALPEESIDMVFSDPPWDDDSVELYGVLAKIAKKVLRPGRHLFVYSGKMFMPEIMAVLTSQLEYVWTMGIFQPDSNDRINKLHVYSSWRPVIVMRKPGETKQNIWTPDSARSTRTKEYHEWGQGPEPIRQWMEAFTEAGEIVLDPFVGGGAVPAVAKELGRQWIAFDKDEQALIATRKRLGIT